MTGACGPSFAQSCRIGDNCDSYAQHASARWLDGNDAVEHALAHAYLGGDYGAIPVTKRHSVGGGVLVGLRPNTQINQKVYDDAYGNCQNEIRFRVHRHLVRY